MKIIYDEDGNILKNYNFQEDPRYGKLFYNPISEELEIKRKLMEVGNLRVYSRSSEVMQYYKEKFKDIERE